MFTQADRDAVAAGIEDILASWDRQPPASGGEEAPQGAPGAAAPVPDQGPEAIFGMPAARPIFFEPGPQS